MSDIVEILLASGETPVVAHPGDAGADIVSNEDVTIEPGERVSVGTGLTLALPDGFVGFVVPRSGLAAKHGITVLNSPGTIDAGYRGEIRVTLLNTDQSQSFRVTKGERIAQLIVMPFARASFVRVDSLPMSERGEGGFGSTGTSALGSSTSSPE